MRSAAAVVLLLVVASCAHVNVAATPSPPRCDNRQIVTAFYTEALIERQPRAAFGRYVSEDFVEHKPDVPGGTRDGAVAFLESLIKDTPEPRWEMLRTIAEGDMVFVHARFSPARGAGYYAIADVFRLRDCQIVEHWDVVAGPPVAPANPNDRF